MKREDRSSETLSRSKQTGWAILSSERSSLSPGRHSGEHISWMRGLPLRLRRVLGPGCEVAKLYVGIRRRTLEELSPLRTALDQLTWKSTVVVVFAHRDLHDQPVSD